MTKAKSPRNLVTICPSCHAWNYDLKGRRKGRRPCGQCGKEIPTQVEEVCVTDEQMSVYKRE